MTDNFCVLRRQFLSGLRAAISAAKVTLPRGFA
jgi:hypothetical protein